LPSISERSAASPAKIAFRTVEVDGDAPLAVNDVKREGKVPQDGTHLGAAAGGAERAGTATFLRGSDRAVIIAALWHSQAEANLKFRLSLASGWGG
jgi:hypothetical protein